MKVILHNSYLLTSLLLIAITYISFRYYFNYQIQTKLAFKPDKNHLKKLFYQRLNVIVAPLLLLPFVVWLFITIEDLASIRKDLLFYILILVLFVSLLVNSIHLAIKLAREWKLLSAKFSQN